MWRGHVSIARTGGSIAFAGLLAIIGIAMTPRTCDAQSQEDCHPTPSGVNTPAPDGYLAAQSPTVCRDVSGNILDQDLTNGGYVKVGNTIRQDADATVYGVCDIKYWDPSGPTPH